MAGIGRNRVFDKAAMEELKTQATTLMAKASSVTEELAEEMALLIEAAAQVPAEAVHPGLAEAASELSGKLDTQVYDDLKTKLEDVLSKLCSQIPLYDSQGAAVLAALSDAAGTLAAMLEDLKGLIGQGSLTMSLEEFKGKLEEYEKKWQAAGALLAGKTSLAMTYLKGLVFTSYFSKDPVNLSTGNFFYEKEDLSIRALTPLVFKRYYNAMDQHSGDMGQGWSHTHGEYLEKREENRILHSADGKETTFRKKDGEYRDIHTGRRILTEDKDGYRFREDGRDTLCFDGEGRLKERRDEQGNAITYTHDEEGRIASACLPAGESLSFGYDPEGHLKEVTDHTGRRVKFFYMEGQLHEVTDPLGNTVSYRYGENGKVRGIKNARNILTVRNEYDEKGRVLRQRFPDKGEMTYAYDEKAGTTTLTERNGSRIVYVQDERLRNVKTIYHDSEERDIYDERDLRTSHTDRNGNTTQYRYDEKGNLTGLTNALGQESCFAYNKEGKLLKVSDSGNTLLENVYDEEGHLMETRDALSRSRKMTYDERGLATSLENADGSRMEFTYDERGNLTRILDPYGGETLYAYDGLNRVVRTTDGNGNAMSYAYDEKDRIIQAVNPEGRERRYAYNESGKVMEITDFDGGKTVITYNKLNRPETITDREGRVTRRSYDRMWNMEKETLPSGAVTSYHYDQDNRLSRVELRQGEGKEPERVFSYTHDPNGNLLKVTAGGSTMAKGNGEDGPAGERAEAQEEAALSITRYEYDALNRPVSVTDGEGNKTCYTYDGRGNLASVTDPAGNTVTYRYNAAGEKTEERDGQGNTVTYEYSLLGQPVRITDPAGRATSHEYLPGGRLWKTVYPDGRTVSYTYDKNGNVKTRENSDGYVLTYHYDCMNRITKITSSRGQSKAYTYDALGNVTAVTDTKGNTTSYEYTLSGKLSAVTDALGSRTEYRYDALDNLILVRQKGNAGEEDRVTEYLRDPLGQIRTMRDALGEEEQYVYDGLGRVAQKTDRDGYVTTNTYHRSGKLASVLYGDGTGVEYFYDALQRLVRVKDWLGETTIQRDKTGNPEKITDPEGREVSYEWGRLGEKKAVVYPDGKRVRYHYDEMLRLFAMDMEGEGAEGTGRISYQYDEKGRLARKQFPGGITTSWSYNETGLPSELLHEDGEGVLDRYQYTYDLGGNRTGIRRERRGLPEESGDYGYTYDPLGRLAQVSRNGSLLRSYRYDSFSNRTETEDHAEGRTYAFAYDARNRLTAMEDGVTGKEYAYDRRGNLTGEIEEGILIRGYSYGAMNRLSRAWNGQGEEASYLYNGLGQRIGRDRREGGRTLKDRYLLDQTRSYHNLLGIEREGDVQTFYYDGNVAAMEDGKNGIHYYLQDELGSPLRVSGYGRNEGTESRDRSYAAPDYLTYGYDEFGNDLYRELEESGIPSPYDKQGEEQPFGYTGYRYDEISGTYFAQARDYQPENGRFTAEDVIKGNQIISQSLNIYIYCTNNPINYFDPLGFEKIVVSGGVYKQAKFEEHAYYYEFIDASLAQIDEWKSNNNDEEITWIIADNGWSDLNKSEFEKAAEHKNVNLIFVEDKSELINYLNYKSGEETSNMLRSEDKISNISFFSHGLSQDNGIISLGFNYENDRNMELDIGISDLSQIGQEIFTDDVVSYLYSCNSGTAGNESIGQEWANLSGGKTYAFHGKSDYAGCSDKSLYAKIIRNIYETFFKVSAFGGNTSLPVAGQNSYQVEFCPE